MTVDLFDLELVGVVVAFNFGGTHLESLSHLSFLLAALADLGEDGLEALGDFIHLEVSGDLDGSDGHCHELVDSGAAVVVGVGVEAGVGVVLVIFLGFTVTLLGQDKFGGLLARYFGVVGVGSEELFNSLLLAGIGGQADAG